jgi:hypothetical protein
LTAAASIVGAAAGAASGAIAGAFGAALGAVLGALAGAAAGRTIEEDNTDRARASARLDKEIGVIGGDLGAPPRALGRPSLDRPPLGRPPVRPTLDRRPRDHAESLRLSSWFVDTAFGE